MERMAILQYNGALTRRFFKNWRHKTDEKLEEHYKMVSGLDFIYKKLRNIAGIKSLV